MRVRGNEILILAEREVICCSTYFLTFLHRKEVRSEDRGVFVSLL